MTYTQPDFTAQSGSAYKTNIDDGFAAAKLPAIGFHAQAQDTPDMTVKVNAGNIHDVGTDTLTTVAEQNTSTITAPSSDPRIDRIVIDSSTGIVSVITGTEASSPVAPAITSGDIPVAQVSLTVSQSQIVDADITDERPTYLKTAGGNLKVSANDTTASNLEDKLLVGTALSLSTQNDGGNETRTVDVDIASQVEAEAGTATNKLMTPERTKQAIDALASASVFTESFLSSATTYNSSNNGTTATIAHGLGTTPIMVDGFMQCTTADKGYSVGDRMPFQGPTANASGEGVILSYDATNIYLTIGAQGVEVLRKNNGACESITSTFWDFYVRAFT